MAMQNYTVYSSFGGIYIARTGKTRGLALDKREAEREVITAVIDHMMHECPEGAAKDVLIRGQWYTLSVEPVDGPQGELK